MTVGLAGDTMLGRMVAERVAAAPASVVADDVVAVAHEADLFVLNLECAISDRGRPWPDPYKPYFFRAPPAATEVLTRLGVDCVTLANNHALDFGAEALVDTVDHLAAAGIASVGAGADQGAARRPAVLDAAGGRIGVVGLTDHPQDFAATPEHAGVAFADLRDDVPEWVLDTVGDLRDRTDAVLVTPHWGPNMVPEPVPHVRRAAEVLHRSGASLVAGHSAHVFHGVGDGVLYDLGDFVDDYATDPALRNDRGLLFLVTLHGHRPVRLQAVPLALDYCHTRRAAPDEARWIADRFRRACAAFGTEVSDEDGRLVIEWPDPSPPSG
ncbi:MAG: CapA family protein [Acidimicrobiales bacterium]|nr:CapA family protein [Acidimicrobiales bacterium]